MPGLAAPEPQPQPQPRPQPSSNPCATITTPLPSLPAELWARIFRHLPSANALCAAAQVCQTWHEETTQPRSERLWRLIWDIRASQSSATLLSARPWALVPGDWRAQVAAAQHLARAPRLLAERSQPAPICIHVPPRYETSGDPVDADRMSMPQGRIDVEDVLGRATAAVTMGKCVVVGFERGIGLIVQPGVLKSRPMPFGRFGRRLQEGRNRPAFFYDDASLLGEVLRFASRPVGKCGLIIGVTSTSCVVSIEVVLEERRKLRWTVIDNFAYENGSVVELSVSEDDRHALIGFDTGRVRVVNIQKGGCRRVFTLSESAEMVVANGKWVIGANSFQPIGVAVWDLEENASVHTFTQISVGWEEITTIAGVAATKANDVFAIWNGYDAIRLLNAKRGEFVRTINIRSMYTSGVRSATEEGEHGAPSPHLGGGKIATTANKERFAVATSNRVFIATWPGRTTQVSQFDNARHSLVALSTDGQILVTAESNAFGALGSKVAGRAAIARAPRLRFWGINNACCRSEHVLLSPVTTLSVCGDSVAAVSPAVGEVTILFGTPR